MPFSRNTIGRIIRNLGASALRKMADAIAKEFDMSKPANSEAARVLLEKAAELQGGRRRGRSRPRPTGSVTPPPIIPPPVIQRPPGSGATPPPPPPPRITPAPPGGFRSRIAGGQFRTQAEPPRPGDEPEYGEEILTPNSTNVYSFSYARMGGALHGTLYVTFQAHTVGNVKKVVTTKGGRKSRVQLRGQSGRTVGAKTGGRGATYAYYRVPPKVYRRLLEVKDKGNQEGPGVKSPGTGVWDMLRVRSGSTGGKKGVFGHQYNYALVQGQVTPDAGGVYIARRLTAGGFKTRSITDLGSGQRGFQTSTLPEQGGFRTRSAPRN